MEKRNTASRKSGGREDKIRSRNYPTLSLSSPARNTYARFLPRPHDELYSVPTHQYCREFIDLSLGLRPCVVRCAARTELFFSPPERIKLQQQLRLTDMAAKKNKCMLCVIERNQVRPSSTQSFTDLMALRSGKTVMCRLHSSHRS